MSHKLQRDYERLIPTIQWLSLAAQFISGATAAFGIYVVILQRLPISITVLAIAVTVVLTIIIIGSFEGGIRRLYPFWIRQILNWFFDEEAEDNKPSRIRIVLFCMLCVMLVPLVFGTTIASWKASPDLVEYSSPSPELKDVQDVATELDKQNLQLLKQLEGDARRDSIAFAQQVAATTAQWHAKIAGQEAERKRYVGLYQKGHKWAKTHADNIASKTIPKLKADMQTAIQVLHSENAKRLDDLNGLKRKTLSEQLTTKANIVNSTQAENASTLSKTEMGVQKWGGFLAVLAIVSTFFTLFCLSFIEAYEAGILPEGQGVAPPPARKTNNGSSLKRIWNGNNTQQQHVKPTSHNNNHTKKQSVNGTSKTANLRVNHTTQQVVAQSVPTNNTTKTIRVVADVGWLKNNIRTYYARALKPTSAPQTKQKNMKKVERWIAELELLHVQTELQPDGTVVFRKLAEA